MDALQGEEYKGLDRIAPPYASAVRNLLDYLALRRRDIRDLQAELAELGLSSLGRCEASVRQTLSRVLTILRRARRLPEPPPLRRAALATDHRDGAEAVARNAARLLGVPSDPADASILVTLPSTAAADPVLVRELLEAAMTIARINCAHDDEPTWECMIRIVEKPHLLLKVAELPALEGSLLLRLADRLRITNSSELGRSADTDATGRVLRPAQIGCPLPGVFGQVKPGERIAFDDGRIGGVIVAVEPQSLLVEITEACSRGSHLRGDQGINLPDTALVLPALTERD